jgi:hypothetical protein
MTAEKARPQDFLASLELVILMHKSNMFSPMTYNDIFLSHEIKAKIENEEALYIDDNDCQLYEPKGAKRQKFEITDDLIFFADIESDVSGEEHVPFMLCC